jgi:thioredoxin 1
VENVNIHQAMKPIELTSETFVSQVNEPKIVFIDFWASWCGPCRAFGPIFEAAAERHPDIVFGKVDTEAQQDLAAALEIRSIPTLMIFRDGVLLFSQAGMLPAKVLDELAEKVRALDMDEIKKKIAEAEQTSDPG